LNREKSEIVCAHPDTVNSILPSLQGAQVVEPAMASLLGSSTGDVSSVSDVLRSKTNMLKEMGDRLKKLSAHDAVLLLQHSFAHPKLLYNVWTSPSPVLQEYDWLLKSIVEQITNVPFNDNDPAWTQATLPVKMGGLGIQSAVQLAPSAFLASAAASSDLVYHIVPPQLQGSPMPHVEDAQRLWAKGHDRAPPQCVSQYHQKA